MTDITLRAITPANWRECIMLLPSEDQRNFVYSNLYSLAESQFEPDWRLVPLGVYSGEVMVGFVMYGRAVHSGVARWFIFRLMVDHKHQGKGYGQAALQAVIQRMATIPDCDAIYVSYAPKNTVARKLYENQGFTHTGLVLDQDIVLQLPLNK